MTADPDLLAALRRGLEASHPHEMRDACGMAFFPLVDLDRYLAEATPAQIVDGLIRSMAAARNQLHAEHQQRKDDDHELTRLRTALAELFRLAPEPTAQLQLALDQDHAA